MLHPDWPEVVREIFAGLRSLGLAGHAGSFLVGIVFTWFTFWLRKKLKIG